MIPTYRNLLNISRPDLEQLVRDEVPESQQLEFKATPPRKTSDFCKDISAMCNGGGGCIVFGVSERDGVANSLVGLSDEVEQVQLRLAQAAESSIRPRLRLKWRIVDRISTSQLLIVATDRSRVGPHMITANGEHRFYRRTGAHNVKMDVDELRSAFLNSLSEEEIILASHREHSGIYQSLRTTSSSEVGVVVDFFPVPVEDELLDPSARETKDALQQLRCVADIPCRLRVSFDGCVMSAEDRLHHEIRVKRTGVILTHSKVGAVRDGNKCIGGQYAIKAIEQCVKSARRAYCELGVDRPVYACMTMLGCYGWELILTITTTPIPIDLYVLEFPPILFDDPASNTIDDLRIWFDRMWNAVGLNQCPLYHPETGLADMARLPRI